MASSSSNSAAKDLTEVNRKFFDEHAESYDDQAGHQEVIQIIADEILRRKGWSGVSWDEENTRMLDYACGTGLVSKLLAPYTKQLIGMDLSEGMVRRFNQSIQDQGIPSEEMRAIVANLCTDELDPVLSDPEYYDFDVAISTLAFHHFDNAPLAINRIVERLKKGTGVLLIVDFREHEPMFPHDQHQHHHHHSDRHGDSAYEGNQDKQHLPLEKHKLPDTNEKTKQPPIGHHIVARNGFSEEEIKRWYEEAGLVDIDIVDVGPGKGVSIVWSDFKTGEVIKVQRSVFMAKGRRA